MPRGKKKESSPKATVSPKKVKKPYPSREERIGLADQSIARLEKLIQDRKELIVATEKKLKDRQSALSKAEIELQRAVERKEMLANRREGGKAKSGSRKQYYELMAALKASGKSFEEVLADLKGA